MEKGRIRVFIADDHAIVREGLKQIISDSEEMLITGEAENGDELLKKMRPDGLDVLVLDISMPGKSGLELIKDVKEINPELPVLILSMYSEDQYGLRALKAGASGYVSKGTASEELVQAIRKVYDGGKYISKNLAQKLATEMEEEFTKLPHERLSDREFQVMCLIASGKTAKEIADELSLSVKTVSTYRTRILGKMKMKNNAELTHYAFRNRLVE